MPDENNELIDKAGAVLNRQNAQDILDLYNSSANNLNKLGEILKRAGVEAAAEQAPKETVEDESTTEDDAPPPEESAKDEDAEVEEKMVVRLNQQEVNYTAVSVKKGAACSNCRWFHNDPEYSIQRCQLVNSWPLDIVPNGYCDRHEALTAETFEPAPMPVEIVTLERKAQREYASVFKQFADNLKTKINITPRWRSEADSAFIVFKGADGKPKWFARHTNNFEDLEGDIFIERAHDKSIARVEAGLVPMPYLSLWHLQGTEHGRATKVMRDGHIVMAVGEFDDTPFAMKCLKYYQKNRGKIKLSLGAFVPKWARSVAPDIRGKLYTDYNALHITTLPPFIAKAANPFTTFSEDMVMALKPEQKEFLIKEFGQDEAERIERDNETLNKTIEQLVQYKDFADLVTKTEEKPVGSDKTAASLFADMVEGQALVVKIAEGVAKHQTEVDAKIAAIEKQAADDKKAADDTIAALRKELTTVQKQLGAAPRRASSDPKTALTDAEAEQVEKNLPTEFDPMFPGMKVPLKKDA